MRLPNKINSFNESILSKFPAVLSVLEQGDMSASTLYAAVNRKMDDVGDFIEILDSLYALGQIDYIKETRSLRYVGRDQMR